MKKSIFILGVAALAVAMVSCNKDEIKKIDNPTFDGDKAYVVVNINDVNNPSTRATDGGFQYGSSDEYAVNKACFYFYGPDGDYVTEADVWDGGTASEGSPAGNIEFNGYTVVTLKGLTSREYPTWVVTVLNPGTGFKAPNTLAEFEGLLADPDVVGINDESGNFTMATSSFVPNASITGQESYSSTYYFATPVSADNFSLDPVTGNDGSYTDGDGTAVNPIVIYVERLAAKVTLGVNVTGDTVTAGSGTLYPIEVEEDLDGVTGPHTLYVKFNGWTLNGTAKHSNMVKTIDSSWAFTNWSGMGWNDAVDYRSYWGASFNYGIIGDYPTTADPDATHGATSTDGSSYSDYLNYVSYNDCKKDISSTVYEYCAENTNTAGENTTSNPVVITDKSSSAITNLLISATICDESGNALDLVRCDGALYPVDEFLEYAASHIHLYTTADGGETYTQINGSYLEIFNKYDGTVGVQIADAYAETTFYTVSGEEGTEFSGDTSDYCDEHFNKSYGIDAVAYTDGAMYYSIPIEHLNNGSVTGTDENTYPEEGNYGIVRNHIYVLTVTAVDNIGHGVYDPDEVIISQPEPDTYAITAQVNILSWKLVEQSVTL